MRFFPSLFLTRSSPRARHFERTIQVLTSFTEMDFVWKAALLFFLDVRLGIRERLAKVTGAPDSAPEPAFLLNTHLQVLIKYSKLHRSRSRSSS